MKIKSVQNLGGIVVDLNELISLERFARKFSSNVEKTGIRLNNHYSKLRGRGMDFAEVRNYQPGDEIRHMEWRATARTGRPHIKLYQEERERPVVIVVDFNYSMYFGTRVAFKSVIAARLAAIIAWSIMLQGDRVGGLLYSAALYNEFIPKARKQGVLSLLAALSQHTFNLNTTANLAPRYFSEALIRLRHLTRAGSMIVIISDFYHVDSDSERYLRQLRLHNEILAYHICDPLELSCPPAGIYGITDSRQKTLLNMTTKQAQHKYAAYWQEQIIARQNYFKNLQISYKQFASVDDLPRLVWQTFPRKSHVCS